MMHCIQCSKELSPDEIALHKKLVNRGAKEHLCIQSLGAHFGVSVAMLEELIVRFKKEGCALFE